MFLIKVMMQSIISARYRMHIKDITITGTMQHIFLHYIRIQIMMRKLCHIQYVFRIAQGIHMECLV